MFLVVLLLIATVFPATATPYQGLLSLPKKSGNNRFFDIQVYVYTFACYVLEAHTTVSFHFSPIAAVGVLRMKIPFPVSHGTR